MDAAVWTAIGLLAATSLGTLFYLGSRIDALATRMDAGFARVDARFDALDARFDSLAARLDAHLDRHAG
jgi:HalX domain